MRHLIILLVLLGFSISSQAQNTPNPCLTINDYTIVVIGSSTAAGAGANPSSMAWVNRYRDFLDSINPGNDVINLALGGYNTYRLMPSNFVPPINRPVPDTARNITKAISLNPDAIIVNLPSNDAAAGFSITEQLDNFDTIYNHAVAANIPIWICTTQPRNFSNSAQITVQTTVRDSIQSKYGLFAIDFWNGIATTGGTIDPFYDSGDGVHLNNFGHGVLFQRVVDENIPGFLLGSYNPTGVELAIESVNLLNPSICGDSNSTYQVVIANSAQTELQAVPVVFNALNLSTNTTTTLTDTLPGSNSCSLDTLTFQLNTWSGGNFEIETYLISSSDTNALTDTLWRSDQFSGHPAITSINDTGCFNDSFLLQASAGPNDHILWYDSLSGGNLLAISDSFSLGSLSSDTSLFAEAVRGNLFFSDFVETTYQSNINWNGCMFDITVTDSLTIDSFALKINSLGSQTVEVYTKTGSHIGFETNSGAWTMLGSDNVMVTNNQSPVSISPGTISLVPGDTIGVYLQLQNAGSQLSYLNNNSTGSYGNSQLTVLTGSGISHNFSNSFFPRNWNGTVYYHYGFNPQGDCQSPRVEVNAHVIETSVDLGQDTVICAGNPIVLDAGAGLSYQWSDSSQMQTLTVNNTGTYWVEVTEPLAGCLASDTILIQANPFPVSPFPASISNCNGPLSLSAQNPGMTYNWNTGDTSQAIQVVVSGTYVVTITNLCSVLEDSVEVFIQSLPTPVIDDSVACQSLVLNGGNFPGASYLWSTGDTTQSLSVSTSGTYWVEVSNSCGNAIDAGTITIENQLPTAGFLVAAQGLTVNFADTSIAGNNWWWDLGDGSTASQNSLQHQYSSGGSYTITQVVSNSCGSDTATQTIQLIPVGLAEAQTGIQKLKIGPNPFHNQTLISVPETWLPATWTLWNSEGKLIDRRELRNSAYRLEISNTTGTLIYKIESRQGHVESGQLISF